MRGVILAGGTGSRMMPLTRGVNKHLLPVGGLPMIHWPLKVLQDNGIVDITIVSSPDGVGQLAKAMGSGAEFGCEFTYRVQDQPGGLAQALACADTGSPDYMAVVLGDNVFLPSPSFARLDHREKCTIFIAKVDDPTPFGVVELEGFRVKGIEEKPAKPKSNFVATGLYVFDSCIFDFIGKLPPSDRGEVEITSVIERCNAVASLVPGFWGDAGTHEGLAICDKGCRKCAS